MRFIKQDLVRHKKPVRLQLPSTILLPPLFSKHILNLLHSNFFPLLCCRVFDALGTLEASLASQKYLLGERITGPDLMLLPTLCRFDAVYSVLFKCSKRRIIQYPSLTKWMQRMFALPGSFETYNLQAAVESYYLQLFPLNPSGVVPFGPSWKEMGIDPTKVKIFKISRKLNC